MFLIEERESKGNKKATTVFTDAFMLTIGDVMTTPTPSMLAAISRCTLRDDVFNEDPTTQDLETHVAKLAGKEAGLFVLSGTMGNQVSLRSLLVQPPHAVLADHRSHIILYEAGGFVTHLSTFVSL